MRRTRTESPPPAARLAHALTVLLAWVVLATPAVARGEWYDFYGDALLALDAGNGQEAIELLETALARKKRSGYFRTYGNNYIRYSPHFYLGLAHHDAGNCARALESFDRSDEAEETKPTPELGRRLAAIRSRCEEVLSPAPAEPEPAAPVTVESEPEPIVEAVPPIDVARLEQGLEAYLGGEFTVAAEIFGSLVEDSPESARLRLLLGTAQHGIWVTGGGVDEKLLEQTRVQLARAAGLDSALVPDPALCPPPVVALYRSLR